MPGLDASMEKKSQYRTILGLTYCFVAIIKVTFSALTFLSFSSNIQEVISNSLPMGVIRTLVNTSLILNVVFSYPFLVIFYHTNNQRFSVPRLLFIQNTSYCLVYWHSSYNKLSYSPSSNFNPTFWALYGFYFKFDRIGDYVYFTCSFPSHFEKERSKIVPLYLRNFNSYLWCLCTLE